MVSNTTYIQYRERAHTCACKTERNKSSSDRYVAHGEHTLVCRAHIDDAVNTSRCEACAAAHWNAADAAGAITYSSMTHSYAESGACTECALDNGAWELCLALVRYGAYTGADPVRRR